MELRKKMDEIYAKLNNLGESSVLRKSSDTRKEEYKIMKKEEEIKRLEELEKKDQTKSGLFATQI